MTRFLACFCIATAALAFGACGGDRNSPPARSPAAPTPAVPPRPVQTLSGFVRDDNGSPVANHEVTLEAFFTGNKQGTTSTNADGYYEMVLGSTGFGGSFIHVGGGEYQHHYVEALVNTVQNLSLRRLRTLEAGQSTVISIDRESSLAVDGGDWWVRDEVWETLEVRVAEAGAVIVHARLEGSGIVPSLMVIKRCDNGNCFTDWLRDSGVLSVWVKATSRVEIRIAIPTASAPQRVEVTTSLQR